MNDGHMKSGIVPLNGDLAAPRHLEPHLMVHVGFGLRINFRHLLFAFVFSHGPQRGKEISQRPTRGQCF